MVITGSLNTFVNVKFGAWDKKLRKYAENEYTLKKLDPQHTYVAIASDSQDKLLATIEKNANVLFKSNKAVNKVPGHGHAPRNTLIIFEIKE